jgi:nucleoside-diphosphate-sugar epimerase
LKDNPIFITGGTGFIGSYIIRALLRDGYTNIRALRRPTSSFDLLGSAADQVDWIIGDLFDFEAINQGLDGCHTVIHSAGLIAFHKSARRKLLHVNMEGTRNLVDNALTYPVEHFIHISSIAALGRNKDQPLINEQVIFQNSSLDTYYGYTKYLAELEVFRGESEGLPISIINPTLVLGSGRWNEGTAKLFKIVYDGLKYYPKGCGGFVDVRDVAEMVLSFAQKGATGEKWLCSGHNSPQKAVFDAIAGYLGKPGPTVPINGAIREIAWRIERIRSFLTRKTPLITKETLTVSSHCFEFDNRKSIEQLDFSYRPFQLTLEETCNQLLDSAKDGFSSRHLPL